MWRHLFRHWIRGTVGVFLLLVVLPRSARAEMPRIELRVDGLACAFCAYGLEKKLKRLDGVQHIDIRLNEGRVILQFEPDAAPDLDAIRTAVRKAGFTLRQIRVTVLGRVASENTRWVLRVRGAPITFLLIASNRNDAQGASKIIKRWKTLADQKKIVEIRGVVHWHTDDLPALMVEEWRVVARKETHR